MVSEELKKQAHDLAVNLGLEIYTWPPQGGHGCTSWRWGMRSSADQYAKTFDSAEDAAVHFLTTREAQNAMRGREAANMRLMEECRAALTLS